MGNKKMNSLKVNFLKKTTPIKIKSKKERPKVISYIPYKPIDTSVSKLTMGINKIYRGIRKLFENIKNSFSEPQNYRTK